MIENEKQYQVTKEQLARLKRGLAARSDAKQIGHVDPRIIAAERAALQSQVDELQADVTAWEAKTGA